MLSLIGDDYSRDWWIVW